MNHKKTSVLRILLLPFVLFLIHSVAPTNLHAQDRIPREYTNPDEVVTFDRTTSFQRALDVVNEFAQENLNKVIIDRTNTEGSIEISVPPMHWRDAFDLILRVKGLVLVEQQEFFEVVTAQSQRQQEQTTQATGQSQQAQQAQGEQLATIDSREVRINAIFFEGNRRALQEIGVDWSTLTEDVPEDVASYIGGGEGGGGGGGSGQLPATSGFDDQFVAVNSVGAQSVSQNVFSSIINFGEIGTSGIEVQALFSAFEADNLGEILASPSVKVMDGELGRIQVGQDFSIKQRDFAGNVTDQFFSVGTILEVTPTIIEENDTTIIHLEMTAERSSAQPDPVSTIVNKQTAETQAILVDGEATAVAGLYRSEVSEVRRGIPILKDLPPWLFGLRYLFGYNSNDYQMRELVVLVQAEIEPTIAERYGQTQQNKFEVLNDERRRFRDEMENKGEYSPTRMDQLEASDETGVEQPEQPQNQEPEEETEPETEQSAPEEPTSQEMDSTETTQDEVDEQAVVDPEMDTEPVQLNLGGEEEQSSDTTSNSTQQANANQSITNAQADQQQAEPTEEEELPPLKSQGAGNAADYQYFIIGASFTNESNAESFREKLNQEGFNAMILTNANSPYHFVAYQGYNSMEKAETGLADIREYYNSEAWLFIRN